MSERDPHPSRQDKATALEQRLEKEEKAMQQVTTLSIIASVFRAWFGVQTEENRQRDFNANKPTAFIFAGVVFVALMVIAVIVLVNIALSSAK